MSRKSALTPALSPRRGRSYGAAGREFVAWQIFHVDLFSWQGGFAGADEFEHAEGAHELHKFVGFAFVAGNFDGETGGLHIDNFGAKNVGDLHHFRAGFGIDGDFDEDEFAIDVFAFAKVLDLEHVDQLVELLDDLLEGRVVAARDDGHAGGVRVVSGADVESIDIVAATAEQSGDAREHAEFVLHQD